MISPKVSSGVKRCLVALVLPFMFNVAPAAADAPIICGSDWPVWETANGLNSLGKLDGFKFEYRKYNSCIDRFASGQIAVTFMTLYDFVATQRGNQQAVVIAATDYSSGGDGVVLREELAQASDLKGKRFGLQTSSISLYVAHMYLQKQGLSLDDVKIANVAGEFASKAFSKGKGLFGVVGWNPNLDDAVSAGGKKVATSADFPENVFDLIVVRKEALAQNPELYKKLLTTWFAGVNDPVVVKKMAELAKVSVEEFKLWLGDAHIYTDAASSLASFPRMRQVAGEIQTFFSKAPVSVKGKAVKLFGEAALDVDSLFDESLLKGL